VRIGLSGWDYDEWQGRFYPKGLARSRRLAFVGERFATAEINRTFYSLATARVFRSWASAVPDDFVFAVKGSRFVTHNKKLRDVRDALANFFASGLLELDRKLGPILWQLPANLRFDAARVEEFLAELPRATDAAAALARRHGPQVRDPAFGSGRRHGLRHVIEVRHESYLVDEMITIARRHGVALAASHSSAWPYVEEITAGFVYVRLHGPRRLYASRYGERALAEWGERIRAWQQARQPADAVRVTDREPPRRRGRDVYVYFDNDGHAHAPREALRLAALLAEPAP
jgi:uncharacterized protein YecE (DUF72 family)